MLDVDVLLKWLEITEQPVDAVQPVLRVKFPFPIVVCRFLREKVYDLPARPYIRKGFNQGIPLIFRYHLFPVLCIYCKGHHL